MDGTLLNFLWLYWINDIKIFCLKLFEVIYRNKYESSYRISPHGTLSTYHLRGFNKRRWQLKGTQNFHKIYRQTSMKWCQHGGRGCQKNEKSADVFYGRPLIQKISLVLLLEFHFNAMQHQNPARGKVEVDFDKSFAQDSIKDIKLKFCIYNFLKNYWKVYEICFRAQIYSAGVFSGTQVCASCKQVAVVSSQQQANGRKWPQIIGNWSGLSFISLSL